jgi:hypothetical protein
MFSKKMRETNLKRKKIISERMKKNNPSFNKQTIEKGMNTKRINGTLHIAPVKRGGNGKPLPIPQKLLATALGWQTEYSVPTKLKPKDGFPHCYKIDIANPVLKVGIEVDGCSHYTRKKQDMKKEKLLKELGWKILRFTNKEVMTNLSQVLLVIKKEIKDL